MDILVILLILLLVFGGGGYAVGRPTYSGPGFIGPVLWILFVIVLIVLLLRIVGVAL
jgi:uncharacterized membrane protein